MAATSTEDQLQAELKRLNDVIDTHSRAFNSPNFIATIVVSGQDSNGQQFHSVITAGRETKELVYFFECVASNAYAHRLRVEQQIHKLKVESEALKS